jgi:hypothetical protein
MALGAPPGIWANRVGQIPPVGQQSTIDNGLDRLAPPVVHRAGPAKDHIAERRHRVIVSATSTRTYLTLRQLLSEMFVVGAFSTLSFSRRRIASVADRSQAQSSTWLAGDCLSATLRWRSPVRTRMRAR